MMKTRIVDNSNRPAQPEPGEDPAVQSPPIREQARESGVPRREIDEAEQEERERQTGE
ncbi:MAG TPA: hypothetical protein VGQ76_09110 [Thermoanaerobaculia bacterium]|jgi:hypothetical protein|nr:hypothetical protein [Thermoanaerobaculia bacterium]